MPIPKEAADPFDVEGIPFNAKGLSAGEPDGQQVDVAKALGVTDPTEEEETEEEDDEEPLQHRAKSTDLTSKAKAKPSGQKLQDDYSAAIQRNALELYELSLKRAKDEDGYLEKLVKSTDPIDQRMAKKLLERNDFGAKSVAEYQKNLQRKALGDDPVKLELAEIKSSLQELRSEKKSQAWSDWKKENSVRGEAATLADDVHTRYPDMEPAEVLEMVRGKLGVSNVSAMKESTFGGSRADMPESDDTDLDSPVAKRLLKGVSIPKLRKFTRKMAMGR